MTERDRRLEPVNCWPGLEIKYLDMFWVSFHPSSPGLDHFLEKQKERKERHALERKKISKIKR